MDTFIVIAFWVFVFWVCWKWFLGDFVGKLSAAKTVQAHYAARQIPDEAYFEMAGEEVARGTIRKGLWVQATSEALGDEKKAGGHLHSPARPGDATRGRCSHSPDRKFTGDSFEPVDHVEPERKTVISCPHCAGRLRVAASKHLDITCPHCRAVFRTQT